MPELSATPRVKRIQTVSLALLVIAGTVNYIDRATLAVANPLISKDLDLSVSDMGWLLSAFLWAYAFAQLPAGAFADRLGSRRMLTIGLSVWSLGQMLGGAVNSFWQFIGAVSCSAPAKRHISRPAHGSRAIGSICASAARQPASGTAPPRLAASSRCRS